MNTRIGDSPKLPRYPMYENEDPPEERSSKPSLGPDVDPQESLKYLRILDDHDLVVGDKFLTSIMKQFDDKGFLSEKQHELVKTKAVVHNRMVKLNPTYGVGGFIKSLYDQYTTRRYLTLKQSEVFLKSDQVKLQTYLQRVDRKKLKIQDPDIAQKVKSYKSGEPLTKKGVKAVCKHLSSLLR